ncbi:serine hydrolase [Streptomyces sp. NBC_01518]|uniref:serine hydrolase n=1 Tax=Streptomyces sp. NBC_01518 TaxID=2903891 RepID=UPI00386A0EA2
MGRLADTPLLRQPGEAFLHNASSDLQGVLVARAAGRELPEFLAERIFEPLGLTSSHLKTGDSSGRPLGFLFHRRLPRPGELPLSLAEGRLETWLTSSAGRSPALVTITRRPMVMLLDGEGDPGEHAVTPGAEGWSEGFVRTGGQHDTYPDADTVPLTEALSIASYIVRTGNWPCDATWLTDR